MRLKALDRELLKQENSIMNKTYLLLLLLLGFALSSCNNTLSEQYTKSEFKDDLKRIEEKGQLQSSEIALISMYVALGEMAGTSFEGRTYGQILKDAKAFEKLKRSKNSSAGIGEI